jgi:hypothetical protein
MPYWFFHTYSRVSVGLKAAYQTEIGDSYFNDSARSNWSVAIFNCTALFNSRVRVATSLSRFLPDFFFNLLAQLLSSSK